MIQPQPSDQTALPCVHFSLSQTPHHSCASNRRNILPTTHLQPLDHFNPSINTPHRSSFRVHLISIDVAASAISGYLFPQIYASLRLLYQFCLEILVEREVIFVLAMSFRCLVPQLMFSRLAHRSADIQPFNLPFS